jgi:integrase
VRGLVFRITDRNVRTFSLVYRFAGKKYRLTLGSVDEGMTLVAARDAARDAREALRKDVNPVEAKAAANTAAREARENTVSLVADEYLAARLAARKMRPRTHREAKRIFEVDVKPKWGDRSISGITRADVAKLLSGIGGKRGGNRAKHGGLVQRNRTLTRLNAFFAWCSHPDQAYITASPIIGMEPAMKEEPRDRALSDQEIVWFWQGCDELGWPFGPLFKLLLLTAQRDMAEVGSMEWPELDLASRMWTIPGERAKNGKPHKVPLSAPAVDILLDVWENYRIGKYIVFSTTGETAVSGFSRAKGRLDRAMEKLARKAAGLPVDDDKYRVALGLKPTDALRPQVPPWILHDLRRTATTTMASDEKLNIAPHVVDKILNHVGRTINGVARIYNVNEYFKERRAALEAWGSYVLALMQPPKEEQKIVAFRSGR